MLDFYDIIILILNKGVILLIKDNVKEILADIPKNTTLIAATKYVGSDKIIELIAAGVNNIGENRVDAFLEKYYQLQNKDIVWHFIGTLQTRKVVDIIDKIDYLHSLDRMKLASEINKRANKIINCFVQVNISKEESKHGIYEEDLFDFIEQISKYDKIKICGLMTMATNTDDEEIIAGTFGRLKQLQQKVQSMKIEYAPCTMLSMGMSGDFKIAVRHGSTHIRVGQALFKE